MKIYHVFYYGLEKKKTLSIRTNFMELLVEVSARFYADKSVAIIEVTKLANGNNTLALKDENQKIILKYETESE